VLTGEGSDETLAGYTRYAWTVVNARLDNAYRSVAPKALRSLVRKAIHGSPLSAALRRKLEHTFLVRDGNSWPSFYYDNFFSALSAAEQRELLTPEALATGGDAYGGSMNAWERSHGDLLHRMLYADINSYLIELLMKQDQMSMAASIESRVPFLDHELVEFTARIPARHSIRGMAGKFILKQAVDDLLPRSIVYRKKMGFPTPWEYWLAGPQLDEVEGMLLDPRSVERGFFRADAVRRLFAEHRTKSRDHGNRIWRLLNFEMWQRVMIDREPFEAVSLGRSTAAAVLS
jgi:asparagine synthase (glutamine-hydrolysing)